MKLDHAVSLFRELRISPSTAYVSHPFLGDSKPQIVEILECIDGCKGAGISILFVTQCAAGQFPWRWSQVSLPQ